MPTEAEIVYKVEQWLQGQGYETRLELQWRPLARTDLVGRRGSEFVAVEAKVNGWKAALVQAVPQGKAFDKVYIAVWLSRKSRVLQEILTDSCQWSNYVGVLGVSQDGVSVLREPRPVSGWPKQYHRSVVALQFFMSDREGQAPYRPVRVKEPVLSEA